MAKHEEEEYEGTIRVRSTNMRVNLVKMEIAKEKKLKLRKVISSASLAMFDEDD